MPTTALELGLLVLTIEFALVAIAIGGLALRGGQRTHAVQVTAAASLVTKVEATEAARREALSAIFCDTYNFEAAEAERVVTDFIERERAFYNAMIGVHLGRGGKSLDEVPAELTKVIAPWLRLTPKNMINADTVQALENANSMLNQELASTKRVLDELMDEYNAAFHKEQQRHPTAAHAEPDAGTFRLIGLDTNRVVGAYFRKPAFSRPACEALGARTKISTRRFFSRDFASVLGTSG